MSSLGNSVTKEYQGSKMTVLLQIIHEYFQVQSLHQDTSVRNQTAHFVSLDEAKSKSNMCYKPDDKASSQERKNFLKYSGTVQFSSEIQVPKP